MRPVFVKGKMNEQTLSGAVPAGSCRLPVTGAVGYFTAGDLIFVSDADGTLVEFLGPATVVLANEVRSLGAVAVGRSTGARIWKPEHFFQWTVERAMPVLRTHDTGVVARRSAGGVLYMTKVRETSICESLRFEDLRRSEAVQFTDWVEECLNSGLEKFTFCDGEGTAQISILLSMRILQNEKSYQHVTLEIELECLESASYL